MMTHKKFQDLKSHVEMISYGTRNQTTRPPHRLISYVRDAFWILDHEKQTFQNSESIFLCVQNSLSTNTSLTNFYLPVTPVSICVLYKKFDELMEDYYV